MTRLLAILCLATLAACGADGPPTAPDPGLRLSGQASLGVKARL